MSGKDDASASENTPVQRLPSFRPPRDLNLAKFNLPSAKPNTKKYVPNLNVTRKKQEDEKGGASSSSKENDKKANGMPQRGRGRARGRGRGNSNLVQTESIFSEGMGDRKPGAKYMKPCDVESVPRGSAVSKASFSPGESRVKMKGSSKDRDEHERRSIDDDFIDDPEDGCHDYSFMSPISLPLRFSENYALEDICDDEEIAPGVKIKSEPGTPKVKVKSENEPRKEFSNVQELLAQSKSQLIFLQLPTNLPGLILEDKADTPVIQKEKPIVIKKEPGTEDKEPAKVEPSTSNDSPVKPKTASEKKPNPCTIKELQPGCIGKLQILKSGKAKLLLGNCSFLVDLGSQVGFKQDLVSLELNADTRTGDTINLGPLSSRLIVSPEWEDMIKSSFKK